MRLEKGSKAYRKSLDFSSNRSRGYMSLKEDGSRSQKNISPLKHDPLVNPMPFNN
jgi:hypothetical protein